MSRYLLTLAVTIFLAYAGKSLADNSRAFRTAVESAAMVSALRIDGPTDSDCQEIEQLMGVLAKLRPVLTVAQQSVIWEKFPWFAGIACNWEEVGPQWAGNDCDFQ